MNNIISYEILGQINSINIARLDPAAIPFTEGIHLYVRDKNNIPWNNQNIKDVLHKMFYALYISKLISEGEMQDLWANIILSSNKKYNSGVNIIGRNPNSELSWGKAVRIKESYSEEIPKNIKEVLTSKLRISLPVWSELFPSVNLFENGVKEISVNDQRFKDEYELRIINEKVIWMNEKFSVVLIKKPHLSGLHLVVKSFDKYWQSVGGFFAPWQLEEEKEINMEMLNGALEAAVILIGCKKILLDEGREKFYNPEIHFSGNWAIDISKELNKKIFKKEFNNVNGGIMHGHLYATRDPQKYVSLPSRPREEVPEEWKGIEPLDAGEDAKISEMIGQRLTPWLEQNAQGKLS